jgi:hypothetical protein
MKKTPFFGRGGSAFRTAIAALAAWQFLGCQSFGQSKECRAVAKIVNPVLDAIDHERQKDPLGVLSHKDIAKRYEMLAAALPNYPITNMPLREGVEAYRRLFRDASRDAIIFADALDSKDGRRIAGARASASRTVKRESAVTIQWDAVCLPR